MWAAITIDPFPFLAGASGLLLLWGLWPTGKYRQVATSIGAIALSGLLYTQGPVVSSTPQPRPGKVQPVDPVVVNESFEKNVVSLFTGTTAEAQCIAAMADRYATAILFDGSREEKKQKIKTTTDVGSDWAEFQRYRGNDEQPWGERFDDLGQYLSKELVARADLQLKDGKVAPKKLDPTTRKNVARLYQDLAAALLKVKR